MHIDTTFIISSILLLSSIAQWIAWRVKIPAILLLLITGIVLGPGVEYVNPQKLFGDFLFPIVSIGVAIILFEGALTLKMNEIREQRGVVLNLATIGAAVTIVVLSFSAHYLFGLSWQLSAIFGALVCVTGPTVIVPLLRTARLNYKIGDILRWEGITIDPLGALYAVLIYDVVVSGFSRDFFTTLLMMISVSIVLGYFAAIIYARILEKHLIPEFLHNMCTLAFVLTIFTLSNAFVEESGLLSITIAGFVLANRPNLHIEDILYFKETLTTIFISVLFIVLAAGLDAHSITGLGWRAFALLAIATFIARPLAVWLSSIGSSLQFNEKIMLAWIAPRGIVAAAISSLFAIKLQNFGMAEASILVPLTFAIIIGTVVIASLTAKPVAQLLNVADPDPNGVLIIGANSFSIAFARALLDLNYRVRLVDNSWEAAREARIKGIPVYYGHPLSSHSDQYLDLVGLGQLIAMSRRPALNTLVCDQFRKEFGANRIYKVKLSEEDRTIRSHGPLAPGLITPFAFSDNITYQHLMSKSSQSWQIRTTNISDTYTFDDYKANNDKNAIMLFAISPQGRLHIFSESHTPLIASGWRIASFMPPKRDDDKTHAKT